MDVAERYRRFATRLRPSLLSNPVVLAGMFDQTAEQDPARQEQSLDIMLNEGLETVRMVEPHLRAGMRVLEVGGGIGLTYAFLRSDGHDIVSLEPSSGGFGDRYHAGKEVIALAGVDSDGWLPIPCSEVAAEGRTFDLIFSHFVLEHVADLDGSFEAMEAVLAEDGRMVHRCPNYSVPFEPHYNLPLIPGAPRLTERVFPRLRGDPVWEELQFTTAGSVRRICRRHGLEPVFAKGMYRWAFERILNDPSFAGRRGAIAYLARALSAVGLVRGMGHLPAALTTPMTFVVERVDQAPRGPRPHTL